MLRQLSVPTWGRDRDLLSSTGDWRAMVTCADHVAGVGHAVRVTMLCIVAGVCERQLLLS